MSIGAGTRVEPAAEGASQSPSAAGLARAAPYAARDLAYVLLALFAVVSALLVIRAGFRDDMIGFDFRGTLWNAALAIRDGSSPYPAPVEGEVDVGNPALYPPFLMLLVTPLTFLPWWLGLSVWTVLQASAIVGSLLILRVRDARCHVLAVLSAPVVWGIALGNVTLLLVPVVALGWRWRALWLKSGVAVGVAIGAKLFLWPLVFWLVGTRRYRAAAASAATALGVALLPWLLIGADGLRDYPDLLKSAEAIYATHSFSVATILGGLGTDADLASRGALALGCGLAAVAVVVGRRGFDRAAFSLAILATVLGSPILWEYYYALLLVPLAIARPRLSWPWMALPLFYVTHRLPRPLLRSTDLEPGGVACCRPDDVPAASWVFNHAPPALWPALGHVALVLGVAGVVTLASSRHGRATADR